MDQDSGENLRSVTIMAVKDGTAKIKIAEMLSQTTKGRPAVGRILAKLEELPWTLARNLQSNAALRLRIRLERLGASVQIVPPLLTGDMSTVAELPERPYRSATSSATRGLPQRRWQGPEGSAPRETDQLSPEQTTHGGARATEERRFALEPLSLGGVLDRTFQICRSHLWKLLAIAVVPALITAGIALIGVLLVLVVGLTWQSLQGLSQWILVVTGAMLILPIILVLFGLFYLSQGAMIHAVSFIYLSREVRVGQAYRFVLAKLGRFVLTSFLMFLAAIGFIFAAIIIGVILYFVLSLFISGWLLVLIMILAGLLLLVIPAYGITKMLLFDKVVIIENSAYVEALKRSWNLVSGKAEDGWPKTFFMRLIVLLHLFVLINLTISMLFQIPAALLSALMSQWGVVMSIVSQLLTTVGNVIGTVFGSVCLVVFYYDVRNRKEGFDLKMLAAMESRESPTQ